MSIYNRMYNNVAYANEYLELTFDEVPMKDINKIIQSMEDDETIQRIINDDNNLYYEDFMTELDANFKDNGVSIDIPWQYSSQGPYIRGDVKIKFNEYPSINVTVNGENVFVEITDMDCNGYEVDKDDIYIDISYNSDFDYNEMEYLVRKNEEVDKLITDFVDNVNDYLDKKWSIIHTYCKGEFRELNEEFLEFESDENGLIFYYEYDDEGNPTNYVGYDFI